MTRAIAALCLAAIAVAAPPARIVSTTPNITEILFALGAGPRVVGVTTYCRHPEAARAITKIGTFEKPDLERVVTLKPDLVIAQKNHPNNPAAHLARLGIRTVEVKYDSMAEVFTAIEAVAAAVDDPAAGSRLIAALRKELNTVRTQVAGRKPARTAVVVWRNPGTVDGLIAAGRGSYLHDLVEAAGGANIFSEVSAPYPKVSAESLLAGAPEVVIDTTEMGEAGLPDPRRREIIALWGRFPSLPAVKSGRVHPLADDALVSPGPRMAAAARALAAILHPAAR